MCGGTCCRSDEEEHIECAFSPNRPIAWQTSMRFSFLMEVQKDFKRDRSEDATIRSKPIIDSLLDNPDRFVPHARNLTATTLKRHTFSNSTVTL